jgi:hypothetical protein
MARVRKTLEEQFGLKLISAAKVEGFLAIDHVDCPSPEKKPSGPQVFRKRPNPALAASRTGSPETMTRTT